jgi:predicted amidohydrolase YtcJ
MSGSLLIRNVEVSGRRGQDVLIEDGFIATVGQGLPRASREFAGGGGALLPGLADHHIHLLALAAQQQSVDLSGARDAAEVAEHIVKAAASRPKGAWVRVTGYHERMAGEIDRYDLDRLAPAHRVRVQHQTGALWVLNSLALSGLEFAGDPGPLELDAAGQPSGRIWRGDAWLRQRIGSEPPALGPVGRRLAAAGVTAVTDASVTTGADAAAILARAHRSGALPQRLTLMSGGPLSAPEDGAFAVGPVKIVLDDHSLPDLDQIVDHILHARSLCRSVAVHCVAAGELALTLAAFDVLGGRPGDRIEHGGMIAKDAIQTIRALGLTVVTQPAFVRERGDRYLADIDPSEREDLYRCASLRAAGVPVAASSDAPYASPDPWLGVAAACDRRTASGCELGPSERLDLVTAVGLYLGSPEDPGRMRRRLRAGAPADLCLLKVPLADAAGMTAPVAATLISGHIVFSEEIMD